jgi:tetratricopeptide (TPR) repeat protein
VLGWSVLVLMLLASGCRSHDRSAADRPQLRPVSLPDLSRASASVQKQLRERYDSLTRATANPQTAAPDLGAVYGDMGKLLMAAEFRDQAETCFLNAQALASGEMRWPYYLGHLFKTKGETPKSVSAFEQALKLKPDDVAARVWLGEAYLDQGRPDAAEPLFTRALALDPRSIAALFGAGRAALARRDYAGAVGYLEQALSIDPQAAPVHYPLAMAYRELGDANKADLHMRQRGAGDIRPADPLMQELESVLESPIAYEVRGAKALDDGDWPAATAYFRKGIELAPDEPSLHHKLGTALFLNGDADGAARQFEEALRLSPTFAKAHFSLGVLMGSRGQPDEAIDHLAAAVRADPAYAEARLRLADVLRATGRASQALFQYEQVSKLDPRLADASLGSAMALVTLRRYADARDRLTAGMKQYSDQPAFAHLLVRLLAAAPDDRVRDGQAAMNLMRDLLAREQRTIELDEIMAMTAAELGQYGEAVTWQRQAMTAAEQAGRPDRARRMAATLSLYERHQPCRTPWRDEDVSG